MKYLKRFLEGNSASRVNLNNILPGKYWTSIHPQIKGVNPDDSKDYIYEINELFFNISDKHNLDRYDTFSDYIENDNSYTILEEHYSKNTRTYIEDNSLPEIQFEYIMMIQGKDNELVEDVSNYIKRLNNAGYEAYFCKHSKDYENVGEVSPKEVVDQFECIDEDHLGRVTFLGWVIRIKILVL